MLRMQISEGSGHIEAKVIPAQTVLLTCAHFSWRTLSLRQPIICIFLSETEKNIKYNMMTFILRLNLMNNL